MLIFTEKLPVSNRGAIIEKINSISNYLGIDPNWLMAVMNFESGLDPSIVNPISKATGLIQFMPTTAASLGTSTQQLKLMGFYNQLDYVKRYYTPYKGKIKGFVDLYLATFYPYAIGKPNSYVIGSQVSASHAATIAKQNPAFDPLKTGKITISTIKKVILAKVPAQYLKYVAGQTSTQLVLLTLSFLGLGYFIYKDNK